MPGDVSEASPAEHKEDKREETNGVKGKGSGGDEGGRRLHPFIQGLLDTIPEIPDQRQKPEWPVPERAKWLQTAANIFDLIYSGEGGIKIEAAMAQRSPRPGEH
jgi:hypothetical protein